jgi:hypothetical protein
VGLVKTFWNWFWEDGYFIPVIGGAIIAASIATLLLSAL